MRFTFTLVVISMISILGCADRASTPEPAATPEASASGSAAAARPEMPDDEVHRGLTAVSTDDPHGGVVEDTAEHDMGLKTDVQLDDTIGSSWRAIKVRVEDADSGQIHTYDVPLDGSTPLGGSGLVLEALLFIPDFVMDEDGISSRSPDPNNPAARVLITEKGRPEYEGWLFAAMPEVHPFPHPRYRVVLVEGVPVGE